MPTSIFISLPVKDVKKSLSFYESLGFKANPQFTGDDTACVAVSDTISVMMASHGQFTRISPKPIAAATKVCPVLLSLSLDSREAADGMVAKVIAAGDSKADQPKDYAFM